MAEWSNAAVLKTVKGKLFVGSNPTRSATFPSPADAPGVTTVGKTPYPARLPNTDRTTEFPLGCQTDCRMRGRTFKSDLG